MKQLKNKKNYNFKPNNLNYNLKLYPNKMKNSKYKRVLNNKKQQLILIINY